MTRRKMTAAEQIYSCFTACDCGKPDDHRHRLIMFWQQGSDPYHSGYYPASCSEANLRDALKELPATQRPTIMVRVKPSPVLIAMADKLGASVQ
jgi:hypothetical protein